MFVHFQALCTKVLRMFLKFPDTKLVPRIIKFGSAAENGKWILYLDCKSGAD